MNHCLTKREAAKLIGKSTRWLYEAGQRGEFLVLDRTTIDTESFMAFIGRRREAATRRLQSGARAGVQRNGSKDNPWPRPAWGLLRSGRPKEVLCHKESV